MNKPDDPVVSDERPGDTATSEISIVSLGDAVSRTQGGNRSINENKREIYA
ncbi:MAG: albusnodin family lasso peptide [Pseudonocardiales bacterium]|nr:albusnodin family lasso peptide [Pseudonocardiales bacterium]